MKCAGGRSEKSWGSHCNTRFFERTCFVSKHGRIWGYTCNPRAVGRSENPGVPVLFGGHHLPPLVEIGLTDLPKSRGAMAPSAPPGTTGLSPLVPSALNKISILLTN